MSRTGFAAVLGVLFTASIAWTGRAQQPPAGSNPNPPRFTGRSDVLDSKEVTSGRRSFEPGARTYWHSHEKGQLIFTEEGRGLVQRRGEPIKELKKFESDYTGPNVVHWHGAAANDRLVQYQVSFGGQITWMEPVTDEEYAGKSRR